MHYDESACCMFIIKPKMIIIMSKTKTVYVLLESSGIYLGSFTSTCILYSYSSIVNKTYHNPAWRMNPAQLSPMHLVYLVRRMYACSQAYACTANLPALDIDIGAIKRQECSNRCVRACVQSRS